MILKPMLGHSRGKVKTFFIISKVVQLLCAENFYSNSPMKHISSHPNVHIN